MTTWYDLVERAADEQRTPDLALLIDEAPDGESARRVRELAAVVTAQPAGAVFLFAGLMVDRADAERRRLPPDAVPEAAQAIEASLDELGASTGDHAVTGGACGGDLLFAEAALRHGLRLDVLIPFEIPEFLEQSVAFAGADWVERFDAVVADDLTTLHVMPEAVGATEPDGNPYERTNRWLVHHARSGDPAQFNLIVLWDGRPGRGLGGTGDLYDRAGPFATEKRIIKPHIEGREVETVSLRDRLDGPGPKRILALDGGGMRGAITLGYLLELERILAQRHGRPVEMREYFDLIGGTSTGSVIAAGLALGLSTQELLDVYKSLGGDVFGRKRRGMKQVRAFFDAAGLERQLNDYFGDRTMDDESITTGLCIVTKRADTRSTWPLINHPGGKFYDHNRRVTVAAALRASTAAPAVFEPTAVDVGGGEIGAFVDGGVSTAKNPALQLFLIATLSGYPFRWPTGKDNLLLVSFGTGFWSDKVSYQKVLNRKLWNWATEIPGLFLEDVGWLNQLMLQSISDTPTPWEIDSEVGDLSGDLLTKEPLLSYLRYDVALDEPGLDELNLKSLASNLGALRDMTRSDTVDDLAEIGRRAAAEQIRADHLPEAFDL